MTVDSRGIWERIGEGEGRHARDRIFGLMTKRNPASEPWLPSSLESGIQGKNTARTATHTASDAAGIQDG